jgi:hypothetical protein
MAMVVSDYGKIIKDLAKEIDRLFKGKEWGNDEVVTQILEIYKEAIYQQVHCYLAPQKTAKSEKEIRDILAKYVIGYTDKAKKVNYIGAINPIRAKLAQLSKSRKLKEEYLSRYLDLYDDFMALAAFRSYKYYCIFMQPCFGFTLWEDTQNCFEGYWYYANKMVLDGEVKFLEKQLPTGFGKCALPTTMVRTPRGITTLENIEVGDEIYSMDKNELVIQRVTNKWYTRKKQVKIKTRGGTEIIVSPEHRMYTQRGYVKAEDLSCNDYMYRLCKPIEQGTWQDQDELEFAILMLFEGCCMSHRLTFTQEDNQVLAKFMKLCDKLGFTYRLSQKQNNKGKEVHIHYNQGRPDAILAKFGMLNCLAKNKVLSNLFLDLPIQQRYDFIGLMLATDGYIPIGNSRGGNLTGVSLASKELVNGIQQLLNSCGIYSYIHERVVKNGEKEFDAYVLQIPDEYFHIIAQNCYCYHKQCRVEERLDRHYDLSMKPYCNSTNYPKEVVAGCKEFKKIVAKQFSRNKTFKREIVEGFAKRTGLLQDVIYKDFVWEGIKSVEFIDETTDMIDIEVSNTHNFIANDLVSHNSLSDCFMQSWIFGIDIDNDVFKVCGNDKFTDDCFQNVVEKLMLSPRYAKVFPYYEKFNCDKDLMFSFCSRKDLKFAITGSKKSTNLRIVTKNSDTNGVRAKYLFIDDITQRRDMANLAQHNRDIHSFQHEWFERNYNRNDFYIVASGTTYSQFDILSYLKRVMGGENTKKSAINKYTSLGVSDFIVPKGVSVFVCVPLLDYDTDESTYPKKISTHSARKKREENPTEFWAMDMQQPLPPDSSPFYFTKLRQYTTLPNVGECNRLDTCVAALDTKRRGKDFLSMPIFFEADDPDIKGNTAFYLNDWLYDDRPMKECIPLIVAKIIQRRITRLFVERNTEECIETLLQDKLREQGYTSCVIEEVYSTEPKDRRIMSAEGDIKSKMIFPRYGMYAQSNDIGKALMNVYGYTYTGTVAHDDAPDSLALFAKRFIMNNSNRYATISTFHR